MAAHDFQFGGFVLEAHPGGVLWLPTEHVLVVSDLHLGKAGRIARREGRLTPPYEIAETLTRLADFVWRFDPRTVICLGDSFDDMAASAEMPADAVRDLTAMMAGRRWIWIAGNHDPVPIGLGGECQASLKIGPITFRHIANPAEASEISGHYHPKVWMRGRGRPAFLVDSQRIIMPAFGAYTGGLDICDPAFDNVMSGDAIALMTGRKIIAIPRAGVVASAHQRRATGYRTGVAAPVRTGV